MEQRYLADTNTIIDYLGNKLPKESLRLIDGIDIFLSVISRIELLVWKNATEDYLNFLNDFIDTSTVFGLTEPIILKSIEIRKTYRLKLPDAIIAATAVTNNLTLLTRNLSDFKKIAQLNCIDPYQV
ncbi:type II toxin-antitoxin system VapC family toxin [Mucilaginibacter ginsenosidivorax]|uniref:Type II toxin-antitoxin system VapC family toxin n=1 Tax=Mucilaginibacter ginsenosidivorax TaxID=862126 RepID=A0A5B8VV95_9SPHI|nr:type II toxin-antitoxin system VapC family toxin [Mucilaginibacter ginsenosidivorax]QEC74525.1 type II toxin-antitoxin system VapC family toxin [Mucilaginibacter ginsenosidivorax]